ncbi:MAG: hypothetical protein JNJ57_03445 [Saprospiraceae bacterium]|nr:hypothetical protein [Saprospiraceae bacterium]
MENSTPNSDFEKFLRNQLQQVNDTPDDVLWSKIAAAQKKPNLWMKYRKYGWYAAAATALIITTTIALLVPAKQGANSGLTAVPEQRSEERSETPFENTNDEATLSPSVQKVNTKATLPNLSYIPNFGPRVNSVPGTAVRFSAKEGIEYKDPVSGTRLSIPAGSLVDKNGNAVSGTADLFFREYRTIADYLASGLPMHYSDTRGQFFFNSAGMFEVRVSQNGEQLQMAPGQNYDLTFVPTTELEKVSLYYLEDESKEWRFVPDQAFGQAEAKQPPVATENEAVQGAAKQRDNDCLPDPYEVSGIGRVSFGMPESAEEIQKAIPVHEMIKIGVKTGYDLATGKLAMPRWFLKNPYLTDEQLLFRMESGTVQIKKHRDKVNLFFPEDLDKYFTELDAFKNCYFSFNADSLGGGRNSKRIGSISDEYWQRVVVEHVRGNECVVTLYDGKEGQLQFHALLRGNVENKKFEPEKVMAEYNKLRIKRQEDFAMKNRALRFFLHAAAPFKTQEEWCQSNFEWLEYFEKNHATMEKRYAKLMEQGYGDNDELAAKVWKDWKQQLRNIKFSTQQAVARNGRSQSIQNLAYSISLYRFGVYNCDQIFRLNAGQTTEYVLARYNLPNGDKVVPATISIMDKSAKLFFSQKNAFSLLYVEGRLLDIILTDKNGRQYHLPADQYAQKKMHRGSVNSLTVSDITDKTDSPQAWADLLEL